MWAILSDIHANLEALQAVLADVEQHRPERVLCLGDIVGYGPNPIECLAVNIPESIRVNIGELQLGQAIHVKEMHLPEGVKVLADPDAIVVQVKAPAAEPEPGAAPAAEMAEPERIGRQKPAEEEEEGK